MANCGQYFYREKEEIVLVKSTKHIDNVFLQLIVLLLCSSDYKA